MKMVRIRFADDAESARGIASIMRRGKVVCLPENTFIVPAPAIQVLDELGVSFQVVDEEGVDGVVSSLRDPTSAAI
jgi:hypothetical protein